MTYDELQKLPALISIKVAAQVCGFGLDKTYDEANREGGMIPTISTGKVRKMVLTAELLRNLGIEYVGPHGHQPTASPSVRTWRTGASS